MEHYYLYHLEVFMKISIQIIIRKNLSVKNRSKRGGQIWADQNSQKKRDKNFLTIII